METKRKDDPAPLVVGRISKKSAANLGKVMDGIEREAVEEFKKRLLGTEAIEAAVTEAYVCDASRWAGRVPADVAETMIRRYVVAAIKAAEEQ